MLLVVDNYDSFTWNLVQYLQELGAEVCVLRNDEARVEEIIALQPDRIVISPGPGRPDDAGISIDLIGALPPGLPLLGVCLGHQCIARAFGGNVVPAVQVLHGRTSTIEHYGRDLFARLPARFEATRYHSLVVEERSLAAELIGTAWTAEEPRELMGLRHRSLPIFGVQFHPESILTSPGKELLRNFLSVPNFVSEAPPLFHSAGPVAPFPAEC